MAAPNSSVYSQLGVLLAEKGEIESAVEWLLKAVTSWARTSTSQRDRDIGRLAELRTILEEQRFGELVSSLLDEHAQMDLQNRLDEYSRHNGSSR